MSEDFSDLNECWKWAQFLPLERVPYPESISISKKRLDACSKRVRSNELFHAVVVTDGDPGCLVKLDDYGNLSNHLEGVKNKKPVVFLGSLPRIYD